MSQIHVTLPDGKVLSAEKGSSIHDIIGLIGKGLQKAALAAEVNGRMTDLSAAADGDITLKVFTFKDDEGKKVFWHSASHLMAQAVKRLYPNALVAIGPAIDEGFYYDFDVEPGFGPDDLAKIEAEMAKIVKEDVKIERVDMKRDEALDMFRKKGDIYKVELLEGIEGDATFYQQGDFIDLCRGPHVTSTGKITAFKLLKNAGAYWRGDEKNKMLSRIYGIAFPDKKDLDEYVRVLEEAKERDHRRIGKELDLFHLQDDCPGMVFWHPRGWTIYRTLQNYIRSKIEPAGYREVNTPSVMSRTLWEKSGHWEKYQENMFITESEKRTFSIKPMNCPGHIQIFNQGLRSYRDLPLRIAEFGSCVRNEPSGTLHGIMRVRGFVQDDAHIFCTEEQIPSEVAAFCALLKDVYHDFGFDDILVKFSTRPAKRVGSDELWDKAEGALAHACKLAGLEYTINPGEGAFYGPKLEFTLKDSLGRHWQCGTIQVDPNLPMRLGAEYVGPDGQKHTPVMLHRAILGSLERFIGILIEQYKGAFPVWLSPMQARVISVGEEEIPAAEALTKRLCSEGFRVDSDTGSDTMNYRIRDAAKEKIPYILVIGKKEIAEGTVSVRTRGEQKSETIKVDDFIAKIRQEVKDKK
jgi:threonyl-tRNA synthetase